jgi:hypothetical protein
VRRLGALGPHSNARFQKAVQSILVRMPWVVLGSTKIARQVPQIRFDASAAGRTGSENGGLRVIPNSSRDYHCTDENSEKR